MSFSSSISLGKTTKTWLFFAAVLLFAFTLEAQNLGQPSTRNLAKDSTQSVDNQRVRGGQLGETLRFQDSTGRNFSAQIDSFSPPKKEFKIKINDDAIDAPVEYTAQDSMFFDVKNKTVHLWGRATMKYKTINLAAEYIILDYGQNTVTALQNFDSTGRLFGQIPDFKDGDQAFTAKKIRYNFKTQKGIVYEARTTQNELFVVGEKAKFISSGSDSSRTSTVYNSNALLTTCDHEHPHFGIRASKLKVVPNKVVIVGPSILEIGGIPTPLFLPFGFFPITKTRKAGLLIPNDYGRGVRGQGLGISNLGWYQPINDNMAATIYADLFLRGTWGLRGELDYRKIYKRDGALDLGFRSTATEGERGERLRTPSFSVRWSHRQDQRAHPSRTFSGSINIQSNGFDQRTKNDFNSVYRNQYSSNVNFTQRFPNRPNLNLTMSASHSQNTADRSMRFTLPTVDFRMNRIYPFEKTEKIPRDHWWEKVSLNYSSRLENQFTTTDSLILTSFGLDSMWRTKKFGIEHHASSDVQFTILKYFNFTPNVSFTQAWYIDRIRREFDATPIIKETKKTEIDPVTGVQTEVVTKRDTTFGTIKKFRENGFTPYQELSSGASLSTRFYGTAQFRKGWLRGIRHQVSPSVSFSYVPYLGGKFIDSTLFDSRDTRFRPYSILEEALFLKPNLTGKDRASLSFTLGNTLDAKIRGKIDTTSGLRKDRKISVLRQLSFTGSYDLTADSLNWSQITTGATFPLFKNLSNLNIGFGFDPYLNENGRRVNKTVWKERGKLLSMPRFQIGLNTGMNVRQIRQLFKGDEKASTTNGSASKTDDLLGLFDQFNLTHNFYVERRLLTGGRDTFLITTNSISTRGSIALTSKWSVNVSNIGYDFIRKELVFPDFGFRRDLHCWEMSFNWQPTRGTYFLSINVKPGTLGFLKLPPIRKTSSDSKGF